MLSRLVIQNYALIDNLDIGFEPGLNILTGETGAGKSIILGALALILGSRAESRYFFNQQKKCIIEGTFSISEFHLKTFFEENDLDYDADTVLRREISCDGKSRAFINDTPVNLIILRQFGEKLIDIHSQHATLEINDAEFQLMVVDSLANHRDLLSNFQDQYAKYRQLTTELEDRKAAIDKAKADQDYYQFQLDELEQANIVAGEQEALEQEILTLTNAETIKSNLLQILHLLNSGEQTVLGQLKESVQLLASLEKFHPDLPELTERIKSSLIELKDVTVEIENIEQLTILDDTRINFINEKLNLFYTLQKKHRLADNAALLELKHELEQKLNQILFGDEVIENLQIELRELKLQMLNLSGSLSKNRRNAIPLLEEEIKALLFELGMPDAQLKVNLHQLPDEQFDKNGRDRIKFLFSANKGHQLGEMSKVASGGELARLMLSIKSIIARTTALPTIIFDEIDTGVSGEVAHKVGQIMENLAQNLQVITITHLPQIASKGKAHFFVYKNQKSDVTFTHIKKLSENDRVTEIAKMLSGDKPGEIALLNAKELLGLH
jgi:DNA repair protein RecN (Recombination protein N)